MSSRIVNRSTIPLPQYSITPPLLSTNRLGLGVLSSQNKNDKAEGGPDGQQPDKVRGKLIRVLAFIEHHLQAPDP
jgi:hypothetical protein